LGRNAGRAAATYIWDTRLARPFKIGERVTVSPTLDLFNVVNHPNFDAESYVGALTAGPSSASRRHQFRHRDSYRSERELHFEAGNDDFLSTCGNAAAFSADCAGHRVSNKIKQRDTSDINK